ncbi:putative oxidoreductase YdhV [Sporotomaculum syntrophicum]|uniref:Oxidoreductase YdhV n=1 Tax=Sporotomaculum syntrophicum TaxID=182264 RepID=A0A9D2WQE9_9FIRM|nr:aldehyde ferredoxin oxidoreductase N-terminal domain-containing protein [Sporotomaculum syntrophicum]KAF1085727.1 putative oxidoreductase YdhV [Sporotomaculum syntrophicum]
MTRTSSIRILDINLTDKKFQVKEREDLAPFLGGTGLATKLYAEYVAYDKPPLAQEQPIIITCGPLSAIFPMATKAVATFRSPLTGEWGESHAGMRIAFAMRFAGFRAIIIHGRAERPVYLSIGPNRVDFKDGTPLWGMPTDETGRILRQISPGQGFRSCLRIGPAGENLVAFANVNVDTYRHFGRLGLGAVFGSKQLKAAVIYGGNSEPIPDPKQYREVYDTIYHLAVNTDIMEKYHGLGTSGNIAALSALGALPTENLQKNTFEGSQAISGEAFARDTLVRKVACTGCPVGCIHIGVRRKLFAEGHEYESTYIAYDYEPIYALGTMLGISTQEQIFDLIDYVEQSGMDVMSTGVLLAWLTEAYQKNIVTKEALGIEPAFNNVDNYMKIMDNIVSQPNELYRLLARGTNQAAQKLGGLDYALTLGNHEMAGYHTGYGNLVGLALGPRHSHLDNSGYSFDQKALRNNLSREQVVREIIAEEKWRNVLNSLCVCLFAREVYTRENICAALACVRINMTGEGLEKLGDEVFRLKNQIRLQLGYNPGNLNFANRFFETPAMGQELDREILADMINMYRSQAGI